VLTGLRVSSVKIENTGFKFQYKTLKLALLDCLEK
jgi:NAD dependent epimerase/dehydratase family enzyme